MKCAHKVANVYTAGPKRKNYINTCKKNQKKTYVLTICAKNYVLTICAI